MNEKELLQAGGMETYKVREGDKTYIDKIVRSPSANKDQLKLIETEVTALQNLEHERIPKLIEYSSNGEIKIRREYIPGESLAELLYEQNKLFSIDEVLDIGIQTLEVLDYIHRKGMIHQDIKPSNLILGEEDGKIYFPDMGLAKLRYFSGSTNVNNMEGSFPYMAPEQYRGKAIPASDIFQLGATLIELLTGKGLDNFIEGESIYEQRVNLPDAIDDSLRDVLVRMTENDSRRRYKNCPEALRALKSLQRRYQNSGDLEVTVERSNGDGNSKATDLISLEDRLKKAKKFIDYKVEGRSLPDAFHQVIDSMLKEFGYEKMATIDSYEFFVRENEASEANVFVKTGRDNVYFAKLKDKDLFDKFCSNIKYYTKRVKKLSDMKATGIKDELLTAWKNNQHNSPEFSDFLKELNREYYWDLDCSPYVIFSIPLVTLPWTVPKIKKLSKRREEIREEIIPNCPTEEQIKEWAPYQGGLLIDNEAIQALHDNSI